MFGTIRKHQKWLWLAIIIPTIISFVWVFRTGRRLDTGGRSEGNSGSIDRKPISTERFNDALQEARLDVFARQGQWVGDAQNNQLRMFTFVQWLIPIHEQEQLGIHVSAETAGQFGRFFLEQAARYSSDTSPGPNQWQEFLRGVIQQQQHITASQFESFCYHFRGEEVLQALAGMAGQLMPPDAVKAVWVRLNQPVATEGVFFPASNYLAHVAAPAEAIATYYTNNQSEYRIPERVQVRYVKFNVTNFLDQARTALGTNVETMAETYITRAFGTGTNFGSFGKTREEARTNVQVAMIRERAGNDALVKAKEFADQLLVMNPPITNNPASITNNLELCAAKNQYEVKVTEPFALNSGPSTNSDLDLGPAREEFTQEAFSTTNEPFPRLVIAKDGIYQLGYYGVIPSELPTLEQVRDKVTTDFKFSQAFDLAQTNAAACYQTLTNGLAQGKGFASLCQEAKLQPVSLPPISRSTSELTNLPPNLKAAELREVAFDTASGKVSRPTAYGPLGSAYKQQGEFILFVQPRPLPVDEVKMKADLPRFTAMLQQQQSQAAYELWLQSLLQKLQLTPPPSLRQSAAGGRQPE